MVESEHFFGKIREYVKPGNKVAKLYYGDRLDILRGLSEIVGKQGRVYGVDALNCARALPEELSNLTIVESKIPPLPKEVEDLDAVVIREFLWTLYQGDGKLANNPETYKLIEEALKPKGHLIITENSPLDQNPDYKEFIEEGIQRYIPRLRKVYDRKEMLIYQKED